MTGKSNDGSWKTKIGEEREDSIIHDIAPRLGIVSQTGASPGDDEIRISGKDGTRTEVSALSFRERNSGGIASQLINKVQEQLAYHKKQIEELESTLEELHKLVDKLNAEPIEASDDLENSR